MTKSTLLCERYYRQPVSYLGTKQKGAHVLNPVQDASLLHAASKASPTKYSYHLLRKISAGPHLSLAEEDILVGKHT